MNRQAISILLEARRTKRGGLRTILKRQRSRLAEMVDCARTHSPFYRELYRELPSHVDDPQLLPVTDKKMLMSRFDDWCTDRSVTLEKAQAFIDDPQRIGEQFLSSYTVLTTSGTTGKRGVFVLDERTMAVTSAMAVRMLGAWLGAGDVVRILAARGRTAMVMATGGHFASAVAGARLRKRRGKRVEILSVHSPLPELVVRLNEFQPALLAPYASMASLLATQQERGRLHIRPVLLTLSAEGLTPEEYDRIAKAFGAKVGNSYAATECPFLSYSCEEGWLHVNADWVIAEPVDAEYRPVPPGAQSHTVLVSNLANRVQPILRYDLGDSLLQRPDPCPCGNPLPAIRVQGRSAEVLAIPSDGGKPIHVAPLVFDALTDRVRGLEQLQVVQVASTILRIRTRLEPGADPDATWSMVEKELRRLLDARGAHHVALERGRESPEYASGGKLRVVVPLGKRVCRGRACAEGKEGRDEMEA